ncbi:unnamed protein product, partial [Polarella glacialis]
AWIHVRRPAEPLRGLFDWYMASLVRANFVAPYDTISQRRFFRAHTHYPRYWHGFVWSFIGVFCSVFTFLPLALWGFQIAARYSSESESDLERGATEAWKTPTLLPHVGRRRALPSDELGQQAADLIGSFSLGHKSAR